MNLKCIGCGSGFEAARVLGYCQGCQEKFAAQRERIHLRQRPAAGVFADGKFATGSPESVTDPVTDAPVCGLCGSDQLEPGYGLGSGYGMGSYTFCHECFAFLDFQEDKD